MKFSQALKANSVPDWKHHYIHYSRLKKMIFRLEQLQGNAPLTSVPEHRQSLDFSNHSAHRQSLDFSNHSGHRQSLDFSNPSAPLLGRQMQRTSSGFENAHVDELMFEREIHEELLRVKSFYVEKVRHSVPSAVSTRTPAMFCAFCNLQGNNLGPCPTTMLSRAPVQAVQTSVSLGYFWDLIPCPTTMLGCTLVLCAVFASIATIVSTGNHSMGIST